MSAKPCTRCGGLITFGTDQDTGRVLPLMVGSRVYRVVKENIVVLDPKALIMHVCNLQPTAGERNFSEPKEGSD